MSYPRPEDEPTLVPEPTAQDRSIRALLSVVDDLSVETEEQGLLEATLEHTVESLGLAGGISYLPAPGGQAQTMAVYGLPPPDPEALKQLAELVLRWEKPILRDQAGDVWTAATPLATRERVLGVMTLYASTGVGAPSRQLLQALGKQIGTGLENARLYAELRASAGRLQVLNRLSHTLTASADLREGIKEFAREIATLQSFDRLVWAFVNETGDYLEIVGYPEDSSWGLGSAIPVVGSGPGFVVLNDKPVLERDLLKSHRYIEDMRLLEEGIRSYVLLPLATRGRAIGALALGSKQAEAYDEDTLARLQLLANAVALSLENLRLFERAKELSITDELTPLYNGRFFRQMLDREIKLSDRYKIPVSIVFIDLDRFKPVNDQFGHLRGSRALREVGFLLRAEVRETDYPARFGGDEFVVLLPQTDGAAARGLAERLRTSLEQHVFLQEEGFNIRLGASIGVATYPEDGKTREALVKVADERMYGDKALRRGQG